MPEGGEWGAFYDLHRMPSWTQYLLMCRSLLKAIELNDPEETVIFQMTISEMSLTCLGLLSVYRLFPEFTRQANDLSEKLTAVGEMQGLLGKSSLDEDE